MRRDVLLTALLVTACSHPPPRPAPAAAAPALEAWIDRRADPCVDFYQFACGGWLASHPIPADATRWAFYNEIIDRNRARVHDILEAAAAGRGGPGAAQVGAYYAACMDEAAIDARGLAPLATDLATIAAMREPADVLPAIARLQRRGVIFAPLAIYADLDFAEATRVILEVDRADLALPSPADYASDEAEARELRAAYRGHLRRVFTLLGEPEGEADADAGRALDLESALAAASHDEAWRTVPMNLHNPVAALAPGPFDWRAYLALLGAPAASQPNADEPAYMDALGRLLAGADPAAWRAYLRAQLVRQMAAVLPARFQAEEFDFYARLLSGQKEMRPRWKRCADLVDRDLGEAVGRLFVEEAFPAASKARVKALVERIRAALREDFHRADWISEPTRRAVLRKLDNLRLKIGYPDRWRDYSSLKVERGDAFGNAQRAQAWEFERQLSKVGRPVDRDEWFEMPQTLAASAAHKLNELVFTAGFLQPPLFDPAADEATTLGSLAAVMGHEMTHLYDDGGRRFDADGNLRETWTEGDAREYDRRNACFVDQYSRYTVGDLHVDGQLTRRENVADNLGLRLAYQAAHLDEHAPRVAGFTAEQRFFLAWASIRCANITDERQRGLLKSDPHSPGRYRVVGVVSNMPEFRRAFACPETSPMVNRPACRMW